MSSKSSNQRLAWARGRDGRLTRKLLDDCPNQREMKKQCDKLTLENKTLRRNMEYFQEICLSVYREKRELQQHIDQLKQSAKPRGYCSKFWIILIALVMIGINLWYLYGDQFRFFFM